MDESDNKVLIGEKTYPYQIRRSRRAKRLLLHVDEKGQIEMVVPWGIPFKQGRRMVEQKRGWLKQALSHFARRRGEVRQFKIETGEMLPLLGGFRKLEVVIEKGRKRALFTDGENFVLVKAGSQKEAKEALKRWYKREARDYFEWRTRQMARKIGKQVSRIVVSEAGSQWGSCNQRSGRISLHWRLMLGPKETADYVIAHEAAHLQELSHDKKFWEVVGFLYPNYLPARKWLRTNGYKLKW